MVHMKRIVSLLLVVIWISGVFARSEDKKEKLCITEQEYQVYEAAQISNYQNETTNYPFSEHLNTEFPSISPAVVADYQEKNNKSYSLRCVLKKDGKKKNLTRSYGGNVSTGFSRIGFNKDETEALVYVSWSGLGNTCQSDFVYLKKENDKWEVVKKVMMVIC